LCLPTEREGLDEFPFQSLNKYCSAQLGTTGSVFQRSVQADLKPVAITKAVTLDAQPPFVRVVRLACADLVGGCFIIHGKLRWSVGPLVVIGEEYSGKDAGKRKISEF